MENDRDLPPHDDRNLADEPLHSDEGALTPPHGDELRSEETFGRTDRYTNIDDRDADRQEVRRDRGEGAPATNMGETIGGPRPEVTGRDGDTIVQDSITTGRPLEGEDAPDIDRRAP